MLDIKIDFNSQFYKNCKQQRENNVEICSECPFRAYIEQQERDQNNCHHKWVERLNGYEEGCGAAICCLCGKYGCYHTADYKKMTQEEKKAFHKNGIYGNNLNRGIILEKTKG